MAQETSKAMRRRLVETKTGVFDWFKIFKGRGIDVGCGNDLLPVDGCIPFDLKDGDANRIADYFPEGHFDYLHGSQIIEHLFNPEESLRNWFKILKTGGFLVVTVPDIGSYENFTYPSKYNPDHKASFSMIYKGSCFPVHYHIPTLCKSLEDVAETLLARYVEENYDWKRRDIDQTWDESDGVEIWNEVVFRKK